MLVGQKLLCVNDENQKMYSKLWKNGCKICPTCNSLMTDEDIVNSAYHVDEEICYNCYIQIKED